MTIFNSKVPNKDGCQILVKSNFNLEFLERELKNYHRKHVLEFLKFGFPIDHKRSSGVAVVQRNHKGAREFKKECWKYVEKEVKLGAMIGPFEQPPFEKFYISPLNSVPKKGKKGRRFILDLSFPKGNLVNDVIDKDVYLGQYEKL